MIHSSVPVHLETVSAAYRVHLIRYDERRFPAEWGGEPTVRLDVESHDEAVPGSDGAPLRLAADVALSEVLPLIGALAGQFALAGGVS